MRFHLSFWVYISCFFHYYIKKYIKIGSFPSNIISSKLFSVASIYFSEGARWRFGARQFEVWGRQIKNSKRHPLPPHFYVIFGLFRTKNWNFFKKFLIFCSIKSKNGIKMGWLWMALRISNLAPSHFKLARAKIPAGALRKKNFWQHWTQYQRDGW